jgi:hypothetical protein
MVKENVSEKESTETLHSIVLNVIPKQKKKQMHTI